MFLLLVLFLLIFLFLLLLLHPQGESISEIKFRNSYTATLTVLVSQEQEQQSTLYKTIPWFLAVSDILQYSTGVQRSTNLATDGFYHYIGHPAHLLTKNLEKKVAIKLYWFYKT